MAEAGLYANITVDTREGAVESIAELNVILNKVATITTAKAPTRNDPAVAGVALSSKSAAADGYRLMREC